MLEACAGVLTLSMIMPLTPFLSAAAANGRGLAGIPIVMSKDMTQPPGMPKGTPAHRVLTPTNNHSLAGTDPVFRNSVIGEHSAGARANSSVAASGAAFILPAASNPTRYTLGFVLPAHLPHT